MLEAPTEDPNVNANTNTGSVFIENENPSTQVKWALNLQFYFIAMFC